MRRFFVFALSLGLSLQGVLLSNTPARAADCPESWNISKPVLTITSSPISDIEGLMGTEDRTYTSSLPVAFKPMPGDLFASKNWPLFREQDILKKLSQIGSNVEISASYVSSAGSPPQNLGARVNPMFLQLFDGSMRAWQLRWMGISNNTNVSYRVSILVKGCKEFSVESNSYTFNDLPQAEFGIDSFFKLYETKESFGRKLTFRELEASKDNLIKNIAALSESTDGSFVSLGRIDRDLLGFLFVAINPGGCLIADDYAYGGPFNVTMAFLRSTPCKIGVYSYHPDFNSPFNTAFGWDPSDKYGEVGLILVSTFDAVRSARAEAEAKAKAEAEEKAKVEAAKKKSTITCVKGKLAKKVTAVNPKCPKGYKKKS